MLSPTDCGCIGFSVMNASGIKGVTTAGHCPDIETYNNVNLPFMDGNPGGIVDIQWNRADLVFTVRNLIWDGIYTRYIFDSKPRALQSVGEWVCKNGKTTGYACGTITATDQDGFNIRVNGVVMQGGDSGGPWFWNNTAYGTSISVMVQLDGRVDSIYGPVDNIMSLGLIILPAKYYMPFVTSQP